MDTKLCRQCGITKPIDGFYSNGKRSRGHMPRCKECVKANVHARRIEKIDEIRAYDRMRGQLPHRKAGVKARAHRYDAAENARRFRRENPEKYKAHTIVNNALKSGELRAKPCERCGDAVGVHAHHEDYSKPLEVTWLCPRHHGERHREINEERRRAAS